LTRQSTFELVFGAQDRSEDEEGIVSMTSNKAVHHAGYNQDTMKNDIAIIFLPKPVKETSNLSQIKTLNGTSGGMTRRLKENFLYFLNIMIITLITPGAI